MDQPDTPGQDMEQTQDRAVLIRPSALDATLANLPHETQLATMRQMMETLFNRIDALQQHQAVQLAGVNDRLDAVELELPLIQEQSALRIHDLESRMSAEIEEATRAVVDELSAGFHQEVSGRLGSLVAQIENQRNELAQMRDSKKLAETKLDRVVQDIERLCGNLTPRPPETSAPAAAPAQASPYRVRIAERIRKAAMEAAPEDHNPLIGQPAPRVAPASPVVSQPVRPAAAAQAPEKAIPGFDDWKRRFMESNENLNAQKSAESRKHEVIACPRCYSILTRPATPNRVDGLLRLAGMIPHRCRACSHRFYKKGVPAPDAPAEGEQAEAQSEEMMEIR
jgi:hypothetical protein